MIPYGPKTHDLFDGDPQIDQVYHQDYREGITPQFTSASLLVPLVLCALPIIYHILFLLDYDLLPLNELPWNCLVYLTPTRLLDAIEIYGNPLQVSNPALKWIPRTHAAKSEAIQRILGLGTPGGMIGSVAQAGRRRLSTLPGIKMVTEVEDRRPAGLGNWDNSCYQNSVLQGLASLDSLTGYLTNPSITLGTIEAAEKPDMKMAEALRGLIATLNDSENNGRTIWTPATLKNMSSWQQQDAQEYFSKVLDEIDKEVGKVANLIRTSQGLHSDASSLLISKSSNSLPISTFRNPLEGLIAQRVGCTTCGHSEGLSMIPFNCLTVPLGRAWEHNISECLDEYTKLEQIDGVECGKCTLLRTQRLLSIIVDRTKESSDDSRTHEASKARLDVVNEALEDDDYEEKTLLYKCKIPAKSRVTSTKSRQAVIARPPKSLVVHFNRSLFDEMTGELKKNYSEVRFPKLLDLGSWCLGSSGSTGDNSKEEWLLNPENPMIASSKNTSRIRGPLYELRAVVTHYGRHENGHYICYKKHTSLDADEKDLNEQWWRLSDDDVMKVSEENVLSQGGVFMLFYECIEPASLKLAPAINDDPIAPVYTLSSDPELAAQIPLPDLDDDDLSDAEYQDSFLRTREESIATSVSEFDDDDAVDESLEVNYEPTKAILLTPYIKRVHNENEGAGNQGMVSSGSLVMV